MTLRRRRRKNGTTAAKPSSRFPFRTNDSDKPCGVAWKQGAWYHSCGETRKIKLPTDRTVFSTDNNGYAGNERDETLVDQNLWDSEIAADDRIPDGIGEIGEDDRPVYDEEGYTHAPGE